MRQELLGLPIDVLSMDETVDRIQSMIDEGGVHQHVVLNAAKVVEAQRDRSLREAIKDSDLINADGMAIVWAGRLLGINIPERVTGIDLFTQLLATAVEHEWKPYFLGAQSTVVESVALRAQHEYPSLEIAGYHDGYWAPRDEAEIVEMIGRSGADLLFVALPSPRKEQFLASNKDELHVPFVMGVGGSFDVFAGLTKRAPTWMQSAGLEWAYRLAQEPRRMFKRYLIGNSRFLLLVAREFCRTRLLSGRRDSAKLGGHG